MPGLLLYQDVFEKYPALSLVLEDLFGDILEFHCLVFDFLNRSSAFFRPRLLIVGDEFLTLTSAAK